MTPDFTLSLSFEGIQLLRRTDGGWQRVGEVGLDVPDLAAALADLKAKGLALTDGAPFTTKLLIPDEQIRYERIETARTTLDDVHAALEGKTPYTMADLVIDYEQSGGRTHIAAVASETLAEAEAFASEHGFEPMAFVAAAEPFTFQAEVFFGKAAAAAGIEVLRDPEPVRLANALPPAEPDTATEEVSAPEAAAETQIADTEIEAAEPEPEAEAPPEPEVEDVAPIVADAADAADAPSNTPVASEDAIEAVPPAPGLDATAAPDTVDPADAPDADEPDADEDAPMVMFTSRKREPLPPRTEPEPAVTVADMPEGEPEPFVEPLFTRRKEPPSLSVPVDEASDLAVAAPPVAPPAAVDPPAEPAAPVVLPDPVAPAAPVAPALGTARARAEPPTPAQPPEPEEAAQMAVFGSADRQRGKPRFLALKMTAVLLLVMLLVALWANSWSEEGIAGWFGADTPDTVETVEAPAAQDPVEPLALAPEPAVAPAPSALTPDTAPAATPETPPLPVVRAPTGRILTPAEADRIYAATGVYQRAPRFAVTPQIATLDGLRESAIVITAPRAARAELPATDALFEDVPLAAPLNPPAPGTTFQRDLRGFILATPDGVVTPDGALVIAGQPDRVPPLRPGTEVIEAPDPGAVFAENGEALRLIPGPPPLQPPLRPDDLATALPDAAPDPVEDIAAAVADAIAAEDDAPALDAPQSADASVNLPQDADAPVETAVVPDADAPDAPIEEGLDVVAGTPPVTPPLRPAGLAPDEADASASQDADIVVVDGRPASTPPVRPETVVARAAQVAAGAIDLATLRPVIDSTPYADPALAGFRPSTRPDGLAPDIAEAEPESPDISDVVAAIAEAAPPSAFVNVTERAIPVSERPGSRPRNFDRVVAQAQARIAQQQQQAQAASTQAPQAVTSTRSAPTQQVSNRPAQPTGAVPTTVARAATVDNAIRLRDINLIGVYGRPNDRRALVRLSNGRFVKVEVGSRLDGGRVTAIGDSALNYVKSGRTYALQMPSG